MKKDNYSDIPPTNMELMQMVESLDDLTVVLKGHLYIENFLTLLISRRLTNPDALDVFGLRFYLKVDLATALGIISIDDRGAYKKINNIRNNFAHQPRAYFSDQSADELWASLSNELKQQIRYTPRDLDTSVDFLKYFIIAICEDLRNKLEDREQNNHSI